MTDELTVQTPLELIAKATMDENVDPEKLRALLDVKQSWEQDEARKSFAKSIAAFQATAPIIEKLDTANGRPYARLDRIWRTIKPMMAELGLYLTWEQSTIEDGVCKIRGTLGHESGHTLDLSNDIPVPAGIKGQNDAQRAGSAQTYAKRYALCAALGIVTGDDDDGGTSTEPIDEKQRGILLDWIVSTDTDLAKFCAWLKVDCIESVPATRYSEALAMLKKKEAAQ